MLLTPNFPSQAEPVILVLPGLGPIHSEAVMAVIVLFRNVAAVGAVKAPF